MKKGKGTIMIKSVLIVVNKVLPVYAETNYRTHYNK